MSCKVTWCNRETEFYNKSQQYKYCSTHIQYKKYASNAPLRPWLMYKVEKLLEDKLKCDPSGFLRSPILCNNPLRKYLTFS